MSVPGSLLAPVRAGGRVAAAALLMIGWLALLWAIEIVNALSGQRLDTYGITPRKTGELLDIVPAAFLHVGYSHLASNSLPLLVLGFIAALGGIARYLAVALTITVISGLGVWLISPAHSVTLGASGLIFGLFGYLVIRGFVDRRALDVIVGLVVGVLYGSILWGVLPTATGVSWQAHLFGLVGGVVAAFLFRDRSVALRS
ncbi:rhomboid family intramembrane serine protease [Actinacidiphila epipremni]|uniref:Rhomboid family intramembrane serine protease n=1 Tax=Actinacidiphila epipremni TaxID=2053013 RepID=A0ABX0ZUJ7_9ACTN|nr:rhomboid family intramembrane serine protease [Actinacidiphila epipremni]NJP47690.1 rhomboid family intramembrane serine protease [Actinacidiphila epipremni]